VEGLRVANRKTVSGKGACGPRRAQGKEHRAQGKERRARGSGLRAQSAGQRAQSAERRARGKKGRFGVIGFKW
jgi:hypothetical protein